VDDWLKVDLHIHSALSACADDDMTPNNIVNMARLLGLQAISVTDHQSALNSFVISRLAEQAGILFVPGIEVQTREEVHLLCYFPDLTCLDSFSVWLRGRLPRRDNVPRHFGRQLVFSRADEVVGEERELLQQSAEASLEEVCLETGRLGGCFVPAHFDRPSFGIMSQLGFLPETPTFTTVESSISKIVTKVTTCSRVCANMNIITGSDAHTLYQMVTPGCTQLRLISPTSTSVLSVLRERSSPNIRLFYPNTSAV
jgi:PHP family Zn ribbon phosphoesterase